MIFGGTYLTGKDLRKAGFKKIGQNVRIHSRASIYGAEFVSFGNNVRIDDYAVIIATGPLNIGNYVSIHNFCYLVSKYGITLQDFVTLAPGVKIFSSSDDYSGGTLTGPVVPRELTGGDHGKVVVGKHGIIGAESIVLPGITLGDGVAIGALSLVKTDCKPWTVYAGIPAVKIKSRKKELLTMEPKIK